MEEFLGAPVDNNLIIRFRLSLERELRMRNMPEELIQAIRIKEELGTFVVELPETYVSFYGSPIEEPQNGFIESFTTFSITLNH